MITKDSKILLQVTEENIALVTMYQLKVDLDINIYRRR